MLVRLRITPSAGLPLTRRTFFRAAGISLALPWLDAFAAAPAREPAEIAVSIQGAVNKPGVYRLREGSRIQDLILAAGGARASGNFNNTVLAVAASLRY